VSSYSVRVTNAAVVSVCLMIALVAEIMYDMNGHGAPVGWFWQENRSTSRKPVVLALCPPQIPLDGHGV